MMRWFFSRVASFFAKSDPRQRNGGKRLRVAFVALLLVVLINSLLLYRGAKQLSDGEQWVIHTHTVLTTLQSVLASFEDAEISQRGYILTKDRSYLQPFADAQQAVTTDITQLTALTRDNPLQQQRITALLPLIHARLDDFQRSNALAGAGNSQAALAIITKDYQQQKIAQISQSIAVMEATENALLTTREAAASGEWDELLITGIIAFSLDLIFLVAAFMMVGRILRQQQRHADEREHMLAREQEAHALAQTHASELEALFDTLTDGVAVYDEVGNLLRINVAGRHLLGYSTENSSLPGSTAERSVALMLRDMEGNPLTTEQWPITRILQGEILTETATIDLRLTSLTGIERILNISGTAMRDAHGRLTGAVTVWHDVTVTRQLERQTHDSLAAMLAMAEALVTNAAEPVPTEHAITGNSTLKQLAVLTQSMLGCARIGFQLVQGATETLIPMAIVGLSPTHEQYWHQTRRGVALADMLAARFIEQLHDNQTVLVNMNEFSAPAQANPYPIQTMLITPLTVDQRLRGIFGIDYGGDEHTYTANEMALVRGISRLATFVIERDQLTLERTQALEDLQAANEELLAQNEQVLEATRLKSEFLANMSHELRTPLNGIIGFSEMLYDEKVGNLASDQKEFLGDILTSARHLLQLINDVLDLSKVEAGKMIFTPESVDLAQLVAEVRDILQPLLMQKQLRFNVVHDPALVKVTLDPGKLKQVLYNYLSNAIKFTPEDGTVTLRLTCAAEDHFSIEVEDTGIGIAPADLSRLFGTFQQLDSSIAKKYQGTGLGLALTKRIIEAQGGMVTVRSELGQGSTFGALLPRTAIAASEPQAPYAVTPAQTLVEHILVVAADAADQNWLAHILSDAGYVVDIQAQSPAAEDVCQRQVYAAITIDLALAETLIPAIRSSACNGQTPIVVVATQAEASMGINHSVTDVLSKPLTPAALTAALARAGVKPAPNQTILVVDDDPILCRLLTATLAQEQYATVCAADGATALRLASEVAPVAIILDLLMPEMDGFTFLQRFRALSNGQAVPVIVWTSKDLTAADYADLRATAQSIVLKSTAGTALLVEEVQALVARRQTALAA